MKLSPLLPKAVGCLLLFLSCAVAFFWFYWLTPSLHFHSPEWRRKYSWRGQWIETQEMLRRSVLAEHHNSSIEIGHFGDKNWTERVIRELNSHEGDIERGSCDNWPYHLPEALTDMTNQKLTNWNTAWLGWWESNKSKTQVEWIRDGFREKGIVLQQPLTTNDVVTLLKVLANTNLPSYLKYNAKRWLRDSDKYPAVIRLNELPGGEDTALIQAEISYAQWYGEYWDAPGKLWIDTNIPFTDSWLEEPKIELQPLKYVPIVLVFALAGAGILLLKLSVRRAQPMR